MLLRLAQLEQAGSFSPETGDQLAQDLTSQALQEVQIPNKYSPDIFLTFDSSDSKKLNEYTDKIIAIQYEEALKARTTGTDPEDLIASFKNVAFQLSIIPVPKDIVSVHAKITNNYYIAAEALINLNLADKDPVLGLLSIPIYKRVSEEQPILYKQVQNYLETNGIIFNE